MNGIRAKTTVRVELKQLASLCNHGVWAQGVWAQPSSNQCLPAWTLPRDWTWWEARPGGQCDAEPAGQTDEVRWRPCGSVHREKSCESLGPVGEADMRACSTLVAFFPDPNSCECGRVEEQNILGRAAPGTLWLCDYLFLLLFFLKP